MGEPFRKLPHVGDKVVLLACCPSARDELRGFGLDILQWTAAFDQAGMTEKIPSWLDVIRNEAAMSGNPCVVWIPSLPAAAAQAIRQAAQDFSLEITSESAADVLRQLESHTMPIPDTDGKIFAVCSIRNGSTDLLPHWLDHYSKLGADKILVGIFDDVSPEARDQISQCAEKWSFTCFDQHWGTTHELAHEGQRQSACRAAGALPGTWIIHSDLDEFHEFPAPLPQIVAAAKACDVNAISGHFLDRVTADGTLAPIRPTPSLWEQFPVSCRLTERIVRAWTQKLMMAEFSVPCGVGHHVGSNVRASCVPIGRKDQYVVHHFKWHAELPARLAWGISQPNANVMWRLESVRFLNWLKSNGGRINLSDPALQCENKRAA